MRIDETRRDETRRGQGRLAQIQKVFNQTHAVFPNPLRQFIDRAALLEAEVIELHRKLAGYSSDEAKNCFLDYCKQFSLTGSARFHVELTSRVTPKVPVTHFTLTVSPWGVCFCDLDSPIPVFYLSLRFTDLQSWASSQPKRGKRRFALMVSPTAAHRMGIRGGPESKFIIASGEAETIKCLVDDYVVALMAKKKGEKMKS